jgi:hypothetical protein
MSPARKQVCRRKNGSFEKTVEQQGRQFLFGTGKVIAEILVEGPAKNMALPMILPTLSRYSQ